MDFTIFPKTTARFLIIIGLVFAIISILIQFLKYFFDYNIPQRIIQLFNVDGESNFPTLYSALLLLMSSILTTIISFAEQHSGKRYAPYWKILSIIFVYLFTDELFQVHETINKALFKLNQAGASSRWDVLNSILTAIFILSFAKFFLHLPAKVRRLFFLAAVLFITGAIGIEFVGVHYYSHIYHQPIFLAEVISTIEEFLEMAGISVFIYGLLSYVSSSVEYIRVNVTANNRKASIEG